MFKANSIKLKIKSVLHPEFTVARAIIRDYRDTFKMIREMRRRRSRTQIHA